VIFMVIGERIPLLPVTGWEAIPIAHKEYWETVVALYWTPLTNIIFLRFSIWGITMPSNGNLYFGAGPEIFEKARTLRKHMTPSEKILWQHLKNRKLFGLKFRRQHPIAHFIVDFYCPQAKLVIELDGGIHDSKEQKEHDGNRTEELKQMGIKELRFGNDEVESNYELVLEKIANLLNEKA